MHRLPGFRLLQRLLRKLRSQLRSQLRLPPLRKIPYIIFPRYVRKQHSFSGVLLLFAPQELGFCPYPAARGHGCYHIDT